MYLRKCTWWGAQCAPPPPRLVGIGLTDSRFVQSTSGEKWWFFVSEEAMELALLQSTAKFLQLARVWKNVLPKNVRPKIARNMPALHNNVDLF